MSEDHARRAQATLQNLEALAADLDQASEAAAAVELRLVIASLLVWQRKHRPGVESMFADFRGDVL